MNSEARNDTAEQRKRKSLNTLSGDDTGVNYSQVQLQYVSPVRNLQHTSSSSIVCCPCAHCHCGRHDAKKMAAMEVAGDLDSLPVGYRFIPTDEELIKHYLLKKIKNEKLPKSKINEVYIYENHPKDVVGNYPQAIEDGWYFFTPRNRKYPNGDRPDRQAGPGYWKATGPDKVIKDSEKNIGRRKSLVYYEGHAPQWTKTKWMMHEYVIEGYVRTRLNSKDNKLDDFVLCKIYINGKMKEEVVTDHQQPRVASNNHVQNLTTNVTVKNEQTLVPYQPAQHPSMVSYQVQNNVVVQNYQNMGSPYDLMPSYSRSHCSSSRFNPQHSYFAPPPQQPPIPPPHMNHALNEQLHTMMYRSSLNSNPPPPQVVPPFQGSGDCDPANLLRQNIELTYALDGNDGFFGDNYQLQFDGNEYMIDVDEEKKHI